MTGRACEMERWENGGVNEFKVEEEGRRGRGTEGIEKCVGKKKWSLRE